MLLFSAQEVYAPKGAVAFSFSDASSGTIIDMSGHGAWKKGGQIGAGGSFTDASGTGSWRAISLGTTGCPVCASQSSSGSSVAFTAEFNPRGSAPSFTVEVIIGNGADHVGTLPVENFWTGPPLKSFGTATVTFNPAP